MKAQAGFYLLMCVSFTVAALLDHREGLVQAGQVLGAVGFAGLLGMELGSRPARD